MKSICYNCLEDYETGKSKVIDNKEYDCCIDCAIKIKMLLERTTINYILKYKREKNK